MTIDPSKCANDEAYMVELQNGRTTVGIRLGQPHSTEAGAYPWLVPYWGGLVWCSDEQIKTLEPLKQRPDKSERDTISAWKKIADHPLFAECYADESGALIDAVLARLDYLASLETDVSEPKDRDLMRKAATIFDQRGHTVGARSARALAEVLETEHKVAQEKAAVETDKRTAGLTGKYRVGRIDGKPVDWAFVLQDTDPFTPVALLAYAKACEHSYPALAADLRQKADDLQREALYALIRGEIELVTGESASPYLVGSIAGRLHRDGHLRKAVES